MSEEKIKKINTVGKISSIVAKVVAVCLIIASVATGALAIVSLCVPDDIAKVSLNGTASIQIEEKYLELGKMILSEVREGMTEEGQSLEIAGSEYEYVSADVDGDMININYKSLDNMLGVRNLARIFAGIFAASVNSAVLMFFVLALCNELKTCRSPFDESVIEKMKRLAIALIPWIVIRGIANSISASAFSAGFSLDNGNDAGVVIVVFVIIALIYVFKYGADLQKQSDETL